VNANRIRHNRRTHCVWSKRFTTGWWLKTPALKLIGSLFSFYEKIEDSHVTDKNGDAVIICCDKTTCNEDDINFRFCFYFSSFFSPVPCGRQPPVFIARWNTLACRTRSWYRISVCLSVLPSVRHVVVFCINECLDRLIFQIW